MFPMDHGVSTPGTGGDPYFSSVVSLLHFDGTDASTTFTDVKGKTWTANGDAQIDTAQFKFGTSSGLFDGTGDDINTADHADFNFGTGAFTLEAFARFTSFAANRMIFGPSLAATSFMQVSTGKVLQVYDGTTVFTSAAMTMSVDTWYHIAVSRESAGTTLFMYLDGVDQTSPTIDAGVTFNFTDVGGFTIGGNLTNRMFGWLDEARVTKGINRYPAPFTAPTAAFPDS